MAGMSSAGVGERSDTDETKIGPSAKVRAYESPTANLSEVDDSTTNVPETVMGMIPYGLRGVGVGLTSFTPGLFPKLPEV